MALPGNDPHARPPQAIREVYKKLQKSRALDTGHSIPLHANPGPQTPLPRSLPRSSSISPKVVFQTFSGGKLNASTELPTPETCEVPGLLVYRSLLPPEVQLLLLDRIFHRDLSNLEHLTNVHLHYDVPCPPTGTSYFDTTASDLPFVPHDANIHKAFTTRQYLAKKLRWMTLGGQYDWTNKAYPSGSPPAFPKDIEQLIGSLCEMKPEAAIVNLYSPGDTLSLHRDVSEECDRPLASISLGCDGIFLIGLEDMTNADEPRATTLRLQSGDAVVMSGESRHAWHGVPKVFEGTCPEWMEDWPCTGADAGRFKQWKGWMRGKRINVNVRQMFAED